MRALQSRRSQCIRYSMHSLLRSVEPQVINPIKTGVRSTFKTQWVKSEITGWSWALLDPVWLWRHLSIVCQSVVPLSGGVCVSFFNLYIYIYFYFYFYFFFIIFILFKYVMFQRCSMALSSGECLGQSRRKRISLKSLNQVGLEWMGRFILFFIAHTIRCPLSKSELV